MGNSESGRDRSAKVAPRLGGVVCRRALALLPGPGPGRPLLLATLLGSLGFGLYQAGSVVYFVESVGFSATQVGFGVSVGALAGLVLGLPIGHLADRLGARGVAVAMSVGKALPLAAFPFVDSLWQYVAVSLAFGLTDAGWNVANEAVIAGTLSGSDRVRVSAYLRSAFNIGLTLGSFLSGLAIAANTDRAYLSLFGCYVASSVLVAVIYLRLPRVAPVAPTPGGRRFPALRDLPYLAVAMVSCMTLLADTVLTVGLPLWVVTQTDAPRSLAAWLITLNTVLVVLLQVRAARAADTLPGARRLQRWAYVALVLMCVLVGVSGDLPGWAASCVLVLGTVALTAGEMWGQGARWALRFGFAPEGAQGQYGAAFRLGQLIPRAAGPILVTGLTSSFRLGGWLVLAAIFLVTLLLAGPVVGWAERTRPAGTTMGGTTR